MTSRAQGPSPLTCDLMMLAHLTHHTALKPKAFIYLTYSWCAQLPVSHLLFPVCYRVNFFALKHWQLCSRLCPGLSTFCWSTQNSVMWQILSQWGKRLSLSITLPRTPPPFMLWTGVRKRDCIQSQVDSPSPDTGEGLRLVIFCYHYQCSMLCFSIWCCNSVFHLAD